MKKLLLAGLLLGLVYQANAQRKTLGAGLAYGTDVYGGEAGFFIDGEFGINDQWSVSPDFIIYFIEDTEFNNVKHKRGAWEFNANANYYFANSGAAAVYGIGGLNLSTFTSKVGDGNRVSNSDIGINLGIGSNFDINSKIEPFAEFKFTIGSVDQGVLMFGAKFPF